MENKETCKWMCEKSLKREHGYKVECPNSFGYHKFYKGHKKSYEHKYFTFCPYCGKKIEEIASVENR